MSIGWSQTSLLCFISAAFLFSKCSTSMMWSGIAAKFDITLRRNVIQLFIILIRFWNTFDRLQHPCDRALKQQQPRHKRIRFPTFSQQYFVLRFCDRPPHPHLHVLRLVHCLEHNDLRRHRSSTFSNNSRWNALKWSKGLRGFSLRPTLLLHSSFSSVIHFNVS